MIDNLHYAKLPPHSNRKLNLAYPEIGIFGQNVAHLGREIELSGLENDEELSIPTMTAVPPNSSLQKLNNLMLYVITVNNPAT